MDISSLKNDLYQLKHKDIRVVLGKEKITVEGKGEAIEIEGPGEYEIKGVRIWGERLKSSGKVLFLIDLDQIRIVYLGKINEPLTELIVDELDGVDVLISEINSPAIKQINPSYLITTNQEMARELGLAARQETKLGLNKLSLPEETELVVLDSK